MDDQLNDLMQTLGGVFLLIWILSCITLGVLTIAGMWKVYTKAGEPGWAVLVPFYNYWVLMRIIGRPGWWLLLFLLPVINIVIAFVVHVDLAKSFGRGTGFGIGLALLSFIFYPILGFGNARYFGPAAGAPGRIFNEPPI